MLFACWINKARILTFVGAAAPVPPYTGFTITLRHTTLGRLIGPSQRPLPDNTQHSQETNIHAPRRNSDPQSQKLSGRMPTPYTAQPL